MVPIDDPDTGMMRMFIPSRVTDNLILLANDPGYVDRLKGVGSAELVKAWLNGDWDAIAGAFFRLLVCRSARDPTVCRAGLLAPICGV
jgi:hypothetical protein